MATSSFASIGLLATAFNWAWSRLATLLFGAANFQPMSPEALAFHRQQARKGNPDLRAELDRARKEWEPRRPDKIQCVLGPADGEWITDDGTEVALVPHMVFDDLGNVVRLTQCEYRRAGDVMAFVQRREAIRIE